MKCCSFHQVLHCLPVSLLLDASPNVPFPGFSHRSLVQTNDHLLKELEETRHRHQHEVQQLNWSYEQLKKTIGEPSTIPRDNSAFATMYDSDT